MSEVWLVTGSASGLGRNIAEAVIASGVAWKCTIYLLNSVLRLGVFPSGAMGRNGNVDSGDKGPLKKPFAVTFAIAALSLATWYFFYIESMPLTPAETTFVVFVWVVVVLVGKWLWLRLFKNGKAGVGR